MGGFALRYKEVRMGIGKFTYVEKKGDELTEHSKKLFDLGLMPYH